MDCSIWLVDKIFDSAAKLQSENLRFRWDNIFTGRLCQSSISAFCGRIDTFDSGKYISRLRKKDCGIRLIVEILDIAAKSRFENLQFR